MLNEGQYTLIGSLLQIACSFIGRHDRDEHVSLCFVLCILLFQCIFQLTARFRRREFRFLNPPKS